MQNALQQFHSHKRKIIKVAPADEWKVKESLQLMLKTAPSGLNFLDVLPDPRMKSGDCVLVSEMGVIDASLETQLKAIENSLEKRIKGI